MTLRELVLRPSSGIGLKCLLAGKQCQTVFCTVDVVAKVLIDILTYFANCGLRKHTL